MTGDQASAVRAAMCRPSPTALRGELPGIGEGLMAQFLELSERPSLDGAEQLAANLQGAARLVLQYRAPLGSDEA